MEKVCRYYFQLNERDIHSFFLLNVGNRTDQNAKTPIDSINKNQISLINIMSNYYIDYEKYLETLKYLLGSTCDSAR